MSTWFGIARPSAPIAAERAMREIDRELVAERQPRHAPAVVVVLVGDDDGVEVRRRQTEAAKPGENVAHAEAAVEQDAGAAGFDEEGVALAAAAQRCEAHQGQ